MSNHSNHGKVRSFLLCTDSGKNSKYCESSDNRGHVYQEPTVLCTNSKYFSPLKLCNESSLGRNQGAILSFLEFSSYPIITAIVSQYHCWVLHRVLPTLNSKRKMLYTTQHSPVKHQVRLNILPVF